MRSRRHRIDVAIVKASRSKKNRRSNQGNLSIIARFSDYYLVTECQFFTLNPLIEKKILYLPSEKKVFDHMSAHIAYIFRRSERIPG